MKDKTREHLVDGSIWLRGLHMLVLAIGYNVVEAMLALTAIFQFFSALFTGRVNQPLLQFAKNGSIYIQEVLEFLTFNSEIRPFPFNSWPDEAHTGEVWLDDESDKEPVREFDEATDTDEIDSIDESADDGHPDENKPQ